MPELPEVERARQTLESALGRRIVAVDDSDTYVSRPHTPGEIASALTGHTLATAHRRGKFMWLETEDGPALGLHLGMAGRILVDPEDRTRWDRFTLEFEDGGRLVLRDKRRLGRAVLNPDFSHVGTDAAEVGRDDFRRLIGSGHTRGQGAAAQPARDLGNRQPARGPDPLAGAHLAATEHVGPFDRGPRPPPPGAARRRPLGDPQGRRPHRQLHRGTPARRHVPARRPPARAGPGRRQDDVLVPRLPAMRPGGAGGGGRGEAGDEGSERGRGRAEHRVMVPRNGVCFWEGKGEGRGLCSERLTDIILDCDPGHDDAIALLLALRARSCDCSA